MDLEEFLLYILLFFTGIVSDYTLSFTRNSPLKDDIQTKVRNIVFYMGILVGVYGLYKLLRMVLKLF